MISLFREVGPWLGMLNPQNKRFILETLFLSAWKLVKVFKKLTNTYNEDCLYVVHTEKHRNTTDQTYQPTSWCLTFQLMHRAN